MIYRNPIKTALTFAAVAVTSLTLTTNPAQAVVLPTIVNADFETDAAAFVDWPGYTGGSNPAEITGWAGSGGRGINPGDGTFGVPFRDNGNNTTNVAFLQGNATIAQTVSGWGVGGNYRIAFDYNSRSSGSGAPQVGLTATIGGASFVDTSITPVGGANSYYAGNILLTPTSATNSLSFTSSASADRTALIDNVRVFRNGPTIADNGFENPVQPDNNWEQANGNGGGSLAGSAWTITGGAGITRNISPFQNGGIPAPEGDQHALIQQTGSYVQTITGFGVGADYELSLLAMARQGQSFGNDLEVLLDAGLATEIVLLDMSEITFSSFTELTSGQFLATKDSYELTIRASKDGGNLDGDRTTFIDNVWFNQLTDPVVPEPATATITLLGLGGLMMRRRRIA